MSRGVQPITKARLHCDIEKAVPGHLTAENLQKKGLKSGHGRISKTCQVKQQDHDLGHLGKKKSHKKTGKSRARRAHLRWFLGSHVCHSALVPETFAAAKVLH